MKKQLQKQDIRLHIKHQERFREAEITEYNHTSLEEYIALLTEKCAELKANGAVDITLGTEQHSGYCDEKWTEVTIQWYTLESDEAMEARLLSQEKADAKSEEQKKKLKVKQKEAEKKLYEKLRKKYEQSTSKHTKCFPQN